MYFKKYCPKSIVKVYKTGHFFFLGGGMEGRRVKMKR